MKFLVIVDKYGSSLHSSQISRESRDEGEGMRRERKLKEDKLPTGSTLNTICISTIEPSSSIGYGVSVDKYGSSRHSSQISRQRERERGCEGEGERE